MIRTKGEPGTGDIIQAVRHMRKMNSAIAKITSLRTDELYEEAKQLQVPFELVEYVHEMENFLLLILLQVVLLLLLMQL